MKNPKKKKSKRNEITEERQNKTPHTHTPIYRKKNKTDRETPETGYSLNWQKGDSESAKLMRERDRE